MSKSEKQNTNETQANKVNSDQTLKGVLVEHKEKMSREDVAQFLETIAIKLRDEGTFTLSQGEKSQDVTPADRVELEIKLEEKEGKTKFEIELEWRDDDDSPKLIIE